ncbi:MAG: glycoside hydrolase family 5 protein [Candidatus Thiodiazotropha sp.]|jgi:aryl-phospho-beta-D-glucosidase BglC (GH1 family)
MKTGFFTKNNLLVLVFSSVTVGGAYADVPALTVSSNQILSGGEVKSFAGNSFLPVNTDLDQEKMYNPSVVKWLKDDWKSTIIRVAVSTEGDGSYLDDPEGNTDRLETVVDAAIADDMYVIIDFNFNYTEDNKPEGIAFLEQMAMKYGTYNNVIYEIYSEPLQLNWKSSIKPHAEDVISAIRSIDPDNLIIVGTPNGAQDVNIASQDPIMGNNIAYALHFYAGTHGQNLRDKALVAMNNGIPLIVTQWGTANADGNGEVDESSSNEWMTFLQEHNITHLNLAVSDKDESASIIKPGSNPEGSWALSDLTASGNYVRKTISSWGLPSNIPTNSSYSEDTDILNIDLINFDDLIGENSLINNFNDFVEELTDVDIDEDSLIDTITDLAETLENVIVEVDVVVDSPTEVDVDVDVGSNETFDDLAEEVVYIDVEADNTPDVGLGVDMVVDTDEGDLIDTLDALSDVFVDVGVDVDSGTDVDVDVDVDLGGLIDSEDLEGLIEQITSNELADAVDQILNSDLDNVVDLILSSNPASVSNLISDSDLFDAIDQNDLNSSINRVCNNSSLCLIDETTLTELIELIQLENQGELIYGAIDLIQMIDQVQSDVQADLSLDSLSELISTIDQGESVIQLDILNDVIDLIAMTGEIESGSLLEQDDLVTLIASIALLIQNNTTDPALPDFSFVSDSVNNLFDQTITDGLLVN